MYIIDYKKELIKKFTNKEMVSFLNHEIIKSRYIAVYNRKDAVKVLTTIQHIPNKEKTLDKAKKVANKKKEKKNV
tara:strand:+ start:3129 stop:3353 length:225 start_codon:yes stop_codon:yes gene_type:complete